MSLKKNLKSKDARKVREFDIETCIKGFIVESVLDDVTIKEYFQFKEIQQIFHYPDTGVEIINFNGKRRVFYNDIIGESLELFDALNSTMATWMDSNLN